MPRYYFHLCDSGGCLKDEEGVELPGKRAAFRAALKAARSIMSADLRRGRLSLDGRVEVTDEDGATLLLLRFDRAAGMMARRPPGT